MWLKGWGVAFVAENDVVAGVDVVDVVNVAVVDPKR